MYVMKERCGGIFDNFYTSGPVSQPTYLNDLACEAEFCTGILIHLLPLKLNIVRRIGKA